MHTHAHSALLLYSRQAHAGTHPHPTPPPTHTHTHTHTQDDPISRPTTSTPDEPDHGSSPEFSQIKNENENENELSVEWDHFKDGSRPPMVREYPLVLTHHPTGLQWPDS